MKIGIDCRTILNPESGERAGVGHYVEGLVMALLEQYPKEEFVLYFDYRNRDVNVYKKPNVRLKHFPFSQYGRFLSFGYSHMLISAYLLKEGLDILHVPAGVIPLTYPKKVVYTVHDLAIYRNPEWFPSSFISRSILVPQSLRKADRIIAVSRSTAKDLKKLFNIKSQKVDVVYNGYDVEKIPLKRSNQETLAKFKLPKRYVLFVGTLEPRKNVISLMRAFKMLLDKNPECRDAILVIAGQVGYHSEEVMQKILDLGLKRNIRYLGYVSHNEKVELLKNCSAFVFPSLYEGFGLPVLEALALGAPTITSPVSSMPEIAGRAAIFVDPLNLEALAKAMRDILEKPGLAKKLSTAGQAQAKNFSWEVCARETMKVYRKTVANK
ncbi:glycosyltransferase family 1 protein [Candidatus Parcubacteria bacterium]|jgi:glycosyltransferase involved in cell wall biosynthesis|nr:MAG: glycosyltransferase family 1 protein [Candidatus Parcubacteria bacterium]